MKKPFLLLLLWSLVCLGLTPAARAQGTAFGYQGRLNQGGLPAQGRYDFTFSLFEVETDGVPVAGPLPHNGVEVNNGLFSVVLDFGPGVFNTPGRWLEISVRPNGGGAVTVLAPRTALLPTPYAIQSATVQDGAVGWAQLSALVPPNAGQLLGFDGVDLAWTTVERSGSNGLWRLGSANKIYYNDGNVGIFDSNPAYPLTVRTASGRYGLDHTDGSVHLATYVSATGGWLGTLSNHPLNLFVNGGGAGLALTTSGRIGIGTTTPESKLTVRTTGNFGGYGIEHTDGDVRLCTYLDAGYGAWLGTRSSHALNFFVNDGVPSLTIGVGGATTATPIGGYGSMTLGTPNGESGLTIKGANRADVRFDGTTLKLVAGPGGGPPSSLSGLAVRTTGDVGIGTVSPQARLHVESPGGAEALIKGVSERAILSLDSTLAGQNRVWTLESGVFGTPGLFAIYDRTAGRARLTIDTGGIVGVDVLQIRGGSDLSEHFDIAPAPTAGAGGIEEIKPGMVTRIDPENPGKLVVCSQAYDRRVAGIVSGAGGVKPGMLMSQPGSLADGSHPVALTGRVYCLVDAGYGAIEAGDLLTTSKTPGHAMRVGDSAQAQGAILGKAMTRLKEGRGMVLVLVSLQ